MSTVFAFLSKAAEDPEVANRLKTMDTIELIVAYAAEAGYSFTAKQFVQAVEAARQASLEVNAAQAGELDDAALESVSGGLNLIGQQFGGIPFDSLIGKPLQ